MTYVARVYITTSYDAFNTLGQYLGVGNSYNYIVQEIVVPSPSPINTSTPTPLPSFTTTMVVGSNRESLIWGDLESSLDAVGSISDRQISINVGGVNPVIYSLFYNMSTSRLEFYITNGSTTISPNNWTTLTINGVSYNRTSFTYMGYNSPYQPWWRWSIVTSNPFGTIDGATKTITLT
jgi:hypothetical protein